MEGLCSGVAYVAQVRAVNSVGVGAWSAKSNPFAPLSAQPPGAPLITAVFGRSQSLVVSWSDRLLGDRDGRLVDGDGH